MTDKHCVIPGCVGSEALEGQLFVAKIFQRPVGPFIAATFMITSDKPSCDQIIHRTGFFKHAVDCLALTDVGDDDDGIGTKARKVKLLAVIMHQSAKDRTPKRFPVALPATELDILPCFLLAGFKSFPLGLIPVICHLFDVFIHFAAAEIADMKHFTKHEDFLIEKTAVHADDNRDIATVFESDFKNHVTDHILYAIAVIGMFVPAAKHGIDDEASPIHLQRLKAKWV